MNFSYSDKAIHLQKKLTQFMVDYIYRTGHLYEGVRESSAGLLDDDAANH